MSRIIDNIGFVLLIFVVIGFFVILFMAARERGQENEWCRQSCLPYIVKSCDNNIVVCYTSEPQEYKVKERFE